MPNRSRDALLVIRGASFGYGRRVVLGAVDLTIERGAFVGIVGPNGSGKTTLLRAILGIDEPLAGVIEAASKTPVRVGYVPQRARIDPIFPLRVRDLVAMGRYPHQGPFARSTPRDETAIQTAARAVSIEDLLERPYRDLSGGQQQRALLARALATEPDLLVLDEPTNGMDLAAEHGLCAVVERLHRESGTTVLFVTHLLHLVSDVATELVLIAPAAGGGASRCIAGERDSILTETRLSELYGIPIAVDRLRNRTVIAPRRAER